MGSQERYDALWEGARERVCRGDLVTDAAPSEGDPRWGLSLVLLPTEAVARELAETATALADSYAGEQHVYEAADLHLTISSLEPYRDRIDAATVDHYTAALEASRELLDIRIRLCGLSGSASGVFVQGFDNGTLHPLRAQMQDAAARLHAGVAPPMAFIRDTAHVSLSVHRQAVPEPAAVDLVDRMRRHPFGGMDAAALALVRYRPANRAMRVEPLYTVAR